MIASGKTLHKEDYIPRGEIHNTTRGRSEVTAKRSSSREIHLEEKGLEGSKIIGRSGRTTCICWCDELHEVQDFGSHPPRTVYLRSSVVDESAEHVS